MKEAILGKIKRKLQGKLVSYTRNTCIYPFIYRSYWHYLLHKNKKGKMDSYYSARPNPGAGIGHQLANWIAGYWFAKQFGLRFAHWPFSTLEWENFLGLGNREVHVADLAKKGYKLRKLPLFDETNEKEVTLNKKIIFSYAGMHIVFIAEQDQFYKNQYGVIDEIRQKFYNAPARKDDRLVYDKNNLNIAIHVRRGDIMTDPENPNLAMRYLSNNYFEKVLAQVYVYFFTSQEKTIHIYFFSQGQPEDYPEFAKYDNLHWCMDMGAQDSFLHMVYADVLITSKSSFSYKPALLNRGIKVCPKNFWHGYPNSWDWIIAEDNGDIYDSQISKIEIKKFI